jgi:phospholipase/carboxylesterase
MPTTEKKSVTNLAGPYCEIVPARLAEPEHPFDATVYVPEHYEENYAYPLIVWIPPSGGSSRDVHRIVPRISTRNYLGVGLHGLGVERHQKLKHTAESSSQSGRSDSQQAVAEFAERLYERVRGLRREYHIHSERIFAVGMGEGGALALRLLLAKPEWFGGAIALGARLPCNRLSLSRFRDLKGKRVSIGMGIHDSHEHNAQAVRAGRLLHAAGLTVSTNVYDAGYELSPEMFKDINHWLMEGICSASCV